MIGIRRPETSLDHLALGGFLSSSVLAASTVLTGHLVVGGLSLVGLVALHQGESWYVSLRLYLARFLAVVLVLPVASCLATARGASFLWALLIFGLALADLWVVTRVHDRLLR